MEQYSQRLSCMQSHDLWYLKNMLDSTPQSSATVAPSPINAALLSIMYVRKNAFQKSRSPISLPILASYAALTSGYWRKICFFVSFVIRNIFLFYMSATKKSPTFCSMGCCWNSISDGMPLLFSIRSSFNFCATSGIIQNLLLRPSFEKISNWIYVVSHTKPYAQTRISSKQLPLQFLFRVRFHGTFRWFLLHLLLHVEITHPRIHWALAKQTMASLQYHKETTSLQDGRSYPVSIR